METQINITYNPFAESQKTLILANQKEVSENSKFSRYKTLALQSWCNVILDELKDTYGDFKLEFTGLATDCEDMREAVEIAQSQGLNIEYKENVITWGATERLERLEKLLEEVQDHPIFKDDIKKNQLFAELIDNTFDIFVVATMSSGKSTFINAMLGSELLPTANQATTATIAEILHNNALPQAQYRLSRTDLNGNAMNTNESLDLSQPENLDSCLLSQWNSDIDTQEDENRKTGKINIEGNLVGIQLKNNKLKLKLSDTPGPNNSQNQNHSVVTLEKIKDTKLNPLIIYVLNGNQLGINDDHQLLSDIVKMVQEQGKFAQDRFIFVINKMDEFFVQNKNETILDALEKVKTYLEKKGIVHPKVFPITASLAKLLRIEQLNPELLSEDDEDTLESGKRKINRSEDRDLTQYMELNSRVKAKLATISDETLKRTGLPALEAYICDYIEKYNEPYRISRICKAIRLLVENAQAELEKITSFKNKGKEELKKLKADLQEANEKLSKSKEIEDFIDGLKKAEVLMSDNVAHVFTKTQNQIFTPFMKKTSEKFKGEESPEEANRLVQDVVKKLEHMLNEFSVDLNKLNEEEQSNQINVLNERYSEFVGDLFGDILSELDEKTIRSLTTQTINLNQEFNINKHTEKKTIYHKEKIKRGFFEKLFALDFSDKYRTWEEKKTVVLLDNIWEESAVNINTFMDDYLMKIGLSIKENAAMLTEDYCNQLHDKFKEKVLSLLSTLERQTEADDLEQQIEKAEQNLEFVNKKIADTLTSIALLEAKGA